MSEHFDGLCGIVIRGLSSVVLFRDAKKSQPYYTVEISDVTHNFIKDIEYFQNNLKRHQDGNSNQIVNYTWEKPSEESPSIYKPLENDTRPLNHKNTLDLMATFTGYPHVVKQNKWEDEPSKTPTFSDQPERRRTTVLSCMTQYVEEMNKAKQKL